jgi:hypothetical protein
LDRKAKKMSATECLGKVRSAENRRGEARTSKNISTIPGNARKTRKCKAIICN